jgi:hypothetical protein
MNASNRSEDDDDCAGSVPGTMINDQYRNPQRNTRTAISSATVIAVSAAAARCGQETKAISGSADPHSWRTMCHLNQGSGVERNSSSYDQLIWPISHSAAHAPMAPQNTA